MTPSSPPFARSPPPPNKKPSSSSNPTITTSTLLFPLSWTTKMPPPSPSPTRSSPPTRSRRLRHTRPRPPSRPRALAPRRRLRSKRAASGTSKEDNKPPAARTRGGIRTLSDLNQRPVKDGSDSDSDEPNEYYTGGEKSGMLVQDPTRGGGDVDSIFTQARQFAQGPLEPSSSSESFTGTARTLTGETVPTAAPQPPESINHTITFWRNGFSIDDGPLRRLDDPANAAFLKVKLVWYYYNALGRPDKKKFIARHKSYHGSTLISASLSCLPALHQKFDLPAPFVLHTDCPHYWRYHQPGETEEEFSTRLANNLENLILKEGPETIAAFIAEPVMGAGVIPPPATYFDKIQAVVKKHDILFIADEVICAFGRLGYMYGCDKYNIKPDLVSVAKALSSAYMPIGAVLVSPEISDVIHSQSSKLGVFSHGFTYSRHPVACAVALEALKIYKVRNIVEQVKRIAPQFQDGVKAFSDSPIIGEGHNKDAHSAVMIQSSRSNVNEFWSGILELKKQVLWITSFQHMSYQV